jgi:preprotein translocase SecE subunit
MGKFKLFLHGVKKEAERVRWPDKKSMVKYTSAVLAFCIFFGAFFYVINLIVVLVKDVFK